jgi:hypothetical protein
MHIPHHFGQQQLWIENLVVGRYHPSGHGQDRGEYTQIEQYCPVGRDFEMKKHWIDNGQEQQYSGKGAGNEGDEANSKGS